MARYRSAAEADPQSCGKKGQLVHELAVGPKEGERHREISPEEGGREVRVRSERSLGQGPRRFQRLTPGIRASFAREVARRDDEAGFASWGWGVT